MENINCEVHPLPDFSTTNFVSCWDLNIFLLKNIRPTVGLEPKVYRIKAKAFELASQPVKPGANPHHIYADILIMASLYNANLNPNSP
jgi:hypothetical protein